MKKLLILVSTLLISVSGFFSVATSSFFSKHTIKKWVNSNEDSKQPPLKKQKKDKKINAYLIKLNDIISNINLGELPDDSRANILAALVTLNPLLDINEVYIKNIESDENGHQKCAIVAKPNSLVYSGSKIFYFKAKSRSLSKYYFRDLLADSLSHIIKETDLGELPDNEPGTVLQRVRELNPTLDISQLKAIKLCSNTTGKKRWRIAPKGNSLVYSGNKVVNFYVRGESALQQAANCSITLLKNIIINSDLGELPDDNPNTILAAIERLNPELDISQITIKRTYNFVNNSQNNSQNNRQFWRIRARENQNAIYYGTKNIKFYIRKLSLLENYFNCLLPHSLSNIIRNVNLGELPDDKPGTVLRRLGELNPTLDISQLRVAQIYNTRKKNTHKTWLIKPKAPILLYLGSKRVYSEIKPEASKASTSSEQRKPDSSLTSLTDVVLRTNLDELADNDVNTVLREVRRLNSNLDINQVNAVLYSQNEDGSQTWRISPRIIGTIYSGEVMVSFRISVPSSSQQNLNNIPLYNIITQTNLNILPNNDKKTVLQHLQLLNPGLNINYVDAIFHRVDNNGFARWWIVPTEDSNYIYIVEVYFMTNLNFVVNHVQVPEINLENKKENGDFLNQFNEQEALKNNNNLCEQQCQLFSIGEKQKFLAEIDQQFQLTTIDIGNIKINDKEHILNRISSLNHPLFSNSYFIQNFVFDSITRDGATGHLQHNIFGKEELFYPLINNMTTFTINFTADNFTLNTFIPQQNLGYIENNFKYTILKKIYKFNPAIASKGWDLFIYYVKKDIARIYIFNQNNKIIGEPIEFNFLTRNHTLDSLQLNLDLGELPNNNVETIRDAFFRVNPLLILDNNIINIGEIGTNSANIYGNVPTLVAATFELKNNMWLPYNLNNKKYYGNSIGKRKFIDSISVYYTVSQEKENNKSLNLKEKESTNNESKKYQHDEL